MSRKAKGDHHRDTENTEKARWLGDYIGDGESPKRHGRSCGDAGPVHFGDWTNNRAVGWRLTDIQLSKNWRGLSSSPGRIASRELMGNDSVCDNKEQTDLPSGAYIRGRRESRIASDTQAYFLDVVIHFNVYFLGSQREPRRV